MDSKIEKVKTLITEGRTDEAIGLLIEFCESIGSEHEVSALQLKARYSALEQQIIDGTIADNDKSIELAKITRALFSVLSLIKIEPNREIDDKTIQKPSNLRLIKLIMGGILVAILLFFILSKYFHQSKNTVTELPTQVQKTIFKGKILHADLTAAANVVIEIDKKAAVGTSDLEGNFILEIPDSTMKKGNTRVVIYYNGKNKWSRNLDLNKEVFEEIKIP